MNLSKRWLHDYVNLDVSDQQFADDMTLSGSKVVQLICWFVRGFPKQQISWMELFRKNSVRTESIFPAESGSGLRLHAFFMKTMIFWLWTSRLLQWIFVSKKNFMILSFLIWKTRQSWWFRTDWRRSLPVIEFFIWKTVRSQNKARIRSWWKSKENMRSCSWRS